MAATLVSDIATVVIAIGAVITAAVAFLNYRRLRTVHDEVKTLNGKTIGILADEGEVRRLRAEHDDDRPS